MQYKNPTLGRFFPAITAGILLAISAGAQAAGSAAATVNFSASLVGATCDVNVDRANIAFGSVSSTVIIPAGTAGIDPQLFVLSFSNCASSGVIPKIRITGPTITSGIPLFRNSSADPNYSQGYGIRLVQQGQNTVLGNLDEIALAAASDPITDLYSNPLTLEARLSCGNCTAGPTLHGGALTATVTFQFVYE
ncbi:fimbrial protein [Serratia microhaemolytica]|uniref:fimbrial protein n=1 Tax=Serratia microhaemolytica TaxID=2675110 RepID=UPI000FDE1AB6|nr:fimbrial protein [Serratia microhaemolytica]